MPSFGLPAGGAAAAHDARASSLTDYRRLVPSSLPEEHQARPPAVVARTDTAQHPSPPRTADGGRLLRATAAALGVAALLVLLTWTLLTDASRLADDFWTDTFFIGQQADAIRHGGGPSLFAHSNYAMFYPVFAFYGGTLFAFAGAIAVVVGSAVAAQVIVYILALAAAYGGWLWLARLAGLRSWPAHVPAILYVTAPYVLTNVYTRQDLAEVVATAAIPPLLASMLSILRADELRAGPAAALAASTISLGGSHNLTLLWGATILGITGLAVILAVPSARHLLTKRGILRVLAVAVPAMALNAWYLLPDLAYHADTVIFRRIDEWKAMLRGPNPAVRAEHLFSLGRTSAAPDTTLVATLPVLAMAWVVAAVALARPTWRAAWTRILAILTLVTAVLLVLMSHPKLLLVLPDPWLMIQFSFRLETFVLFGICGAVIAALILLGPGRHRWLTALLLPVAILSIVGAAGQARDAPLVAEPLPMDLDRYVAFGVGDYAGANMGVLSPRSNPRAAALARGSVDRNRIAVTARANPGDLFYLNIMSPSGLIDVQGAHVIKRRALPPLNPGWKPRWYLVLRVDADATPGRAKIVIQQAQSLPIVAGRIISLLGLLGLAANAGVIGLAARRRRRARHAA